MLSTWCIFIISEQLEDGTRVSVWLVLLGGAKKAGLVETKHHNRVSVLSVTVEK
jgi:hypothetical protein